MHILTPRWVFRGCCCWFHLIVCYGVEGSVAGTSAILNVCKVAPRSPQSSLIPSPFSSVLLPQPRTLRRGQNERHKSGARRVQGQPNGETLLLPPVQSDTPSPPFPRPQLELQLGPQELPVCVQDPPNSPFPVWDTQLWNGSSPWWSG